MTYERMQFEFFQEPIPEQRLEGKHVSVAKIVDIFSCNSSMERIVAGIDKGDIHQVDHVGITVRNVTSWGSATFIYDGADYEKLKKAYRVSGSDWLLGKPVLAIYRNDPSLQTLTGFMPLNMDG